MLTISSITATPLAVPLAHAYNWRSGAERIAGLVLFTVETSEGLVGYGEAPFDSPAALAAYSDKLSDLFIGRSPHEIEPVLADLGRRGRWRVTATMTQQALNGIESACWDVWGKALGQPASSFFGGRVRDKVDVFGFPQGSQPQEFAENAKRMVDDGYRTIYLKIGRENFEEDVRIVRAVRDIVGYDVTLRVDANEAWDVPTAIDRIKRLEEFRIDWVEQPIAAGNIAGLADVRTAVSTKIAADNAIYLPSELRAVLEARAADAVVLSSHEVGGLWRLRQMASFAGLYGIPVNRKAHLESGITAFAALQVISTIPNLSLGNQIAHQLLTTQLTTTPLEVIDGALEVPTGNGLSFELDPESIERARRLFEAESSGGELRN